MKQIVSVDGIKRYMTADFSVEVFDVVSSTNTIVKERAKQGEKDVLVVAREQTSGRGRFTRKFFSPKDAGVYFSFAIEPTCADEISFITPMCAVAAAKAIRDVCVKNAQIKWVNDIYVDMKKCVGILCEGVSSQGGAIDRIVCGIGVNLYEKEGGVDEQIKDIAGFVGEGVDDCANKIVGAICNNFADMHLHFDKCYIAKQYKDMSMLVGRSVAVCKTDEERVAIVEDIDDRCRLVVRYEDGECETLEVGEVRIKL